MDSEFVYATLIFIFGLFSFASGFVLIKKKRFMEDKNWLVFRWFTPLPAIINYWLLKLFVIIGSLLPIYLGGYGMGIFP